MTTMLPQFLGLALLCGGIWLGYRAWIRPHLPALDWPGRGLLFLVLLTFMGGFIGSPFWWADEPRAFSWDLPPLAGRMLAAAGWAFAVGSLLVLRRPTRSRARLIVLLLAVYLAPLVAAIFAFHLNRFDFAAPITYMFFLIAASMTAASLRVLFRPPAFLPDSAPDLAPAPSPARGWLALTALVTGLWGLALFAADNGPSALVWAWPGDLLSSRLIGVMLLAIAAGSAWGLRRAGTARLMLAVLLTYGIGLVLAGLWSLLPGKPVPLGYVVVFGVFGVGSAALLLAGGRGEVAR